MSDSGYGDCLVAALQGLSGFAVREIPRRDDAPTGREPSDAGRGQRAAALTAAYHAGMAEPGGHGTLAFGWVRLAASMVSGYTADGSPAQPETRSRVVLEV